MPSTRDMLATLAAVVGANAVRAGTAQDAIESMQPAAVVEPDTPAGVAGVLAAASASRLSVVVRGGGTKVSWGRIPATIDVMLSTRRLARIRSHAHADLTAEVEGGVTLEAMNGELSRERQWLPLESAFAGATIGGMLATNDAGPAQHRFGTPRDLLIGVQLATTDGRLVKAGGNVVKNVAGYDLGKLVTGSFGSLAVIVSATFKLMPLPAAIGTARVTFSDRVTAAAAVQALAASQLEPIALDLRTASGPAARREAPPAELLARFASTPTVVDAELAKAARLLTRFEPVVTMSVLGDADQALWGAHRGRPWEGRGAVIRLSWLPASLDAVLALVGRLGDAAARLDFTCRAGIGIGLLRVDGDVPAQVDVVLKLRQQPDLFKQVTVLRAEQALKSAVDVWGGDTSATILYEAVKRAFDPAGILNAGRGPV
jgi:glycolate oxidase FAD binding subunit